MAVRCTSTILRQESRTSPHQLRLSTTIQGMLGLVMKLMHLLIPEVFPHQRQVAGSDTRSRLDRKTQPNTASLGMHSRFGVGLEFKLQEPH